MSTEIPDSDGCSLEVHPRDDGKVSVLVHTPLDRAKWGMALDRDALLRAVAGDAIIIDRADLPEVRVHGGGITTDPDDGRGVSTHFGDAAWHRRQGLASLAMADYLDAHPPVDEADVEALAAVMLDTFPGEIARGDRLTERARRLLATGRVQVTR